MMLVQSVGIGISSLIHLRFPLLSAGYMLYLLAMLLQANSMGIKLMVAATDLPLNSVGRLFKHPSYILSTRLTGMISRQ